MTARQTVEISDRFSREDLDRLLKESGFPLASIFMPAEPRGRETRQNPVMLKNLLRECERKLQQHNDEERDKLKPALEAVHFLVDDNDFWQHQSNGLALFLSPQRTEAFRLPTKLKEQVTINRSFCVTPLVPLLVEDGSFHVLSLNLGNVRLFQGSHYTMQEVPLPETPASLDEFLKLHEFDKSLQFQTKMREQETSGDRRAVFHGHGEVLDSRYEKKQILRFFQNLDNIISDKLSPLQSPLVLLGPEHLIGLYREASHYAFLSDRDAKVNPERLSEKQLHDRAWEQIEPTVKEKIETALNRYRQSKGRGEPKALDSIEQIVPSACYQRVETLFIANDQEVWGKFDEDSGEVKLGGESAREGEESLLHRAVVDTLRNGGTVYVCPSEQIPDKKPAAAILR